MCIEVIVIKGYVTNTDTSEELGGKSCTGIATNTLSFKWGVCPSAYGLCYRLGLTAIK